MHRRRSTSNSRRMLHPTTNWQKDISGIMVIENIKCYYILGQVLHRDNRFGTGYSIIGRHYITINGKLMAHRPSIILYTKLKGK